MSSLRTVSQFTIAFWVLWMQAPLAFKARCLGSHISGAGLKVDVLDVELKPVSPRGKSLCFELPPDCGSPC